MMISGEEKPMAALEEATSITGVNLPVSGGMQLTCAVRQDEAPQTTRFADAAG